MNGLALCAGYGGLSLACKLVWAGYRDICMVEIEAYAAATLAARMADGFLDSCPIWDDLRTFDGAAWRGCVDIVTAGFPCQPWSTAGQRRGTEDERWIWPDIARVIRDVGPRYVFLENVPGLISHGGLGLVLGDLAEAGLDAEWLTLSAAAVGASHRRERAFILAYARGSEFSEHGERDSRAAADTTNRHSCGNNADRCDSALADSRCECDERWRESAEFRGSPRNSEGEAHQRQWHGHAAGDGSADVADAKCSGLRGQPDTSLWTPFGGVAADGHGAAMGHPTGSRRDGSARQRKLSERPSLQTARPVDGCGLLADAIGSGRRGRANQPRRGAQERTAATGAGAPLGEPKRAGWAESGWGLSGGAAQPGSGFSSLPLFPPGPAERERWAAILRERPDLAPALEREVYRMADGALSGVDGRSYSTRTDRLRAVGNGVVPLQAAVALRELLRRIKR